MVSLMVETNVAWIDTLLITGRLYGSGAYCRTIGDSYSMTWMHVIAQYTISQNYRLNLTLTVIITLGVTSVFSWSVSNKNKNKRYICHISRFFVEIKREVAWIHDWAWDEDIRRSRNSLGRSWPCRMHSRYTHVVYRYLFTRRRVSPYELRFKKISSTLFLSIFSILCWAMRAT